MIKKFKTNKILKSYISYSRRLSIRRKSLQLVN